jgi:hypothetical protein
MTSTTALNSSIVFNSSTGSDTAASGCGPGTAVTGTGASLNATTTVDLSADTPDLSGVSVGDLLWVQTSSGRQFSPVATVDDGTDTITVDDAFTVTESSRTWAIGGKRSTIDNADSRQLFTDIQQMGFAAIELETNQTITSSKIPIRFGTTGGEKNKIYGTAGSIKTIEQSANTYHFDVNNNRSAIFENLKFTNSNATKNTSNRVLDLTLANPRIVFNDCIFGDSTDSIYGIVYCNTAVFFGAFNRCLIQHTDGPAFEFGGEHNIVWTDCFFDTCDAGVEQTNTGSGLAGGVFARCIFKDITNEAIRNNAVFNQQKMTVVDSCIFDNCGTGVYCQLHPSIITINSCIFMDNTTAISFPNAGGAKGDWQWKGNAFYNNTTDYNLTDSDFVYYDDDEITLTGDPFTDSANSDYTLNSTAGSGQTLRETSITDLVTGNVRYPFGWMVDPSGGGGGFRRISLNGGFNG